MSKRINLLRCVTSPKLIASIIEELNITGLELEELIESIDNIERDLIKLNGLGRLFLTRKLDWLSSDTIRDLLNSQQLSEYKVQILDEVPSTNSYVLDKIDECVDKLVLTTEFQSFGRGRTNKRWMSRVAKDITASFVYWFDLEFNVVLLPLIAAIAVNRLLKDFQIRSKIKWPNDVLLDNGEKICGILLDSGVRQNKRFAIIGIGIDNIINIDRNILLTQLIHNLDNVISEYIVFGFNLLKQEWLDNCIHYQKDVNIIKDERVIEAGINTGINDNGALLIRTLNGEVKKYNSANITLRW
ncbi:MAG: biotin--[acetyl-CoA-carboxylase] ligase [Neisseriaceae bacterium]